MGKYKTAIPVLVIISLVSGCSLIDLSTFDLTLSVRQDDQVLEADEQLSVTFSEGVDRDSAEKSLSVTAAFSSEAQELDFFWQGDTKVVFQPRTGFFPGQRYWISLKGQVLNASKIKNKPVNLSRPFYYLTDNRPPLLISFSPAPNGSIATTGSLSFQFSTAMDTQEFEELFSMSPAEALIFTWSSGNRMVTIQPEDQWQNQKIYTWDIPDTVTNEQGIRVASHYTEKFQTAFDVASPAITAVGSALYDESGATMTVLSTDLSVLGFDESIYFEWSEAVSPVDIDEAIIISPSIDGTFFWPSTDTVVFKPSEYWNQNEEYHVEIKTTIEDISGNALTAELNYYFTPLIVPIEVTGITIDIPGGGPTTNITPAQFNLFDPITITPEFSEGAILLKLTLSDSFTSNQAKVRFADSVSIQASFPLNNNPVLIQTTWLSDTVVWLEYNDLVIGDNSEAWSTVYYQIDIAAGQAFSNDTGQYLADEVFVLVATE